MRLKLMAFDGIAYLRPGPFYDPEGGGIGYDGTAFATFIDGAFREIIKTEATDLVLDLRDNHGGDNSFSDPMIAWFAGRPFRFASKYTLKASAETRTALASLAAKYPDLPVLRRMQETLRDVADGKRVPFEIPETRPRPDSVFRGRVWALVNRHTYSNATSVAAVIQDCKFGLILGEETSDTPTSYGSAAQFTLPRTGILVTYPKAFLVRPNGTETLRGVVPDIGIKTPLEPAVEDVVLREAVRIVKERRKR
jgi:C-terminal processing protease CtpA/Prc